MQRTNFHKGNIKNGRLYYNDLDLPKMSDKRNSTIKMANNILAIPAAPAAIPPKPNIAAMIATTRKVIVQRLSLIHI